MNSCFINKDDVVKKHLQQKDSSKARNLESNLYNLHRFGHATPRPLSGATRFPTFLCLHESHSEHQC
jgi:hypothetical protein